MAEYVQTYGHLPRPGDAWVLFLALAVRSPQFWARRQLINFDAVADGVSHLFDDVGDCQRIRDELEKKAHPVGVKNARPAVIQNAWGEGAETKEGTDGGS